MAHYDTLVIGAGFAGAVTAGELARRGGRNVLVLERRDHLGGNAYDCLDAHGVLIHQYGPPISSTPPTGGSTTTYPSTPPGPATSTR